MALFSIRFPGQQIDFAESGSGARFCRWHFLGHARRGETTLGDEFFFAVRLYILMP
jgi:hypothetical protein